MRARLFLIFGALSALAAAQVAAPKFDVVSIKPIGQEHATRDTYGIKISPGRFHDGFVAVEGLIHYAYNVQGWEIVTGGDDWNHFDGKSREYNIDATFAPGATPDQIRLMLRSFLADRFKLQMHTETRVADYDELTIAPGGAKFLDNAAPPTSKRPGAWPGGVGCVRGDPDCAPTTMADFCGSLAVYTRRRVVDKTGLAGAYYIQVWSSETVAHFLSQADADASGAPSIYTALQEQLGLRLVATKGPVTVYYIDYVENPTIN